MCELENRMVMDSQWQHFGRVPDGTEEIREKLRGAGYLNPDSGVFIPEEDAYAYALENISLDEDLKEEFIEWFYSENWIKED